MKKSYLYIVFVFLFASCSTSSSLYYWGDYTNDSYKYYKDRTEKSTLELMKTYEKMIERFESGRSKLPPGIYAEYGYFLVASGKTDEGVEMFQKEKQLYPQSHVFMDRLIKKFSK